MHSLLRACERNDWAVNPYNRLIRHIKGSEKAAADFLNRNLGRYKFDEFTHYRSSSDMLTGSLVLLLSEETE